MFRSVLCALFDPSLSPGRAPSRRTKARPHANRGHSQFHLAAKVKGRASCYHRKAALVVTPRREWTEDGQLWVQYVSSTPATRLDVINLQERLDHQLQQRQVRASAKRWTMHGLTFHDVHGTQARETGICPIREELYAQCFDELIREVTINCAERGLLLLRVRDEMRMTIAAYQTLYESAVAFGMRKALQTEQGKNEMEAKIQTLEGDVKDLERQVCVQRMQLHRERSNISLSITIVTNHELRKSPPTSTATGARMEAQERGD